MSSFFLRSTSLAVAFVALLGTVPASAVSPESPEVKAAVEKALKFLEDRTDGRLGGDCLIGLCFLKNGRPVSHPKVQSAITQCIGDKYLQADNYSLGIAVMFLCEADPDGYRPQVEKMVAHLLSKQQPGGGWSYPGRDTGDTSQTQYAVLALWLANSIGVAVPLSAQENVMNWLLRTQDPNGAWGYQGIDPKNNTRVAQEGVQPSLAAAGLGSTYMMADLLQLSSPPDDQDPNLPAALKLVKEKAPRRPSKTNKVDLNIVRRAFAEGDRWFQQPVKIENVEWIHYYMYALERYRSFRELNEGRFEKEPRWYNEGFNYLAKSQKPDGSWDGKDSNTIATAFAILFLSRSSKKAIAKVVANLGDGVLLGGMGLPPNAADLKEKNGKVVDTPLSGSIDELLSIISDEDNPELARMAESAQTITIDSDVSKRAGQIDKLRKLVTARSYESRLVAVRSLGKVRDLDNVPILLFALTDPDIRVIREADKALRFISLKFDGVGSTDNPSPAQLEKLRADWKKWLLSIRPNAELLD